MEKPNPFRSSIPIRRALSLCFLCLALGATGLLTSCRNPTVVEYEPYESPGARVPQDELYSLQWHYQKIRMPGAWGILQDPGLSANFVGAVVAVLDTGIHHDHPDLDSAGAGEFDSILFNASADGSGYDFYSGEEAYPGTTGVNGDLEGEASHGGAGPDSDPTDTGDYNMDISPPRDYNTWHGSHVSGTIAADTQDDPSAGTGVAGIGWDSVQVLPVRVLGKWAYTNDIVSGIYYAAGIPAESGSPVPQQPAKAINMSLGGYIGVDTALYEGIQAAVDTGMTVLAAAGNSNAGGEPVMDPASYDNTVAVSATDLRNELAAYSNVGPEVDFAAPGGDLGADVNGDGYPDGVLSTSYNESGSPYYDYAFYQGTSMATPHVSGVVGLLYSYASNLNQDAVYAILANTAKDLGEPGHDEQYGHGLIDAEAAIEYLINAGRDYPVQPRSLGGGDAGDGGISTAAVSSLAANGAGRSRGRRPAQRRGAILPEAGADLDTTSILVKLTESAQAKRGLAAARSLADGIGAAGAAPIGGRLYRVDLRGGGNVEAAIRALGTHEDIEYAQPNYRYSLIE